MDEADESSDSGARRRAGAAAWGLTAVGLAALGGGFALGAWLGWFPPSVYSLLAVAWLTALFVALLALSRNPVFLSLAMFAAMVTLLECGVYGFERLTRESRERMRHRYVAEPEYRVPHPVWESVVLPSISTTESRVYPDGVYAYRDVPYVMDAKARRIPEFPVNPAGDRHALFFGCSFTFGMGLPATDTLPWRFAAESAGGYLPFNYAMPGHGPSHMYLRTGMDELFDDIPRERGIAVYSFIDDHLNRCTPYEADLIVDYHAYPHFLIEEGALMGPLRYREVERYRWRDWAYRSAKRYSPTARVFLPRMRIRYQSRAEALRVAAELVAASKRNYDARFDGDFYVIIWPRMVEDGPALDGFVRDLESRGIVPVRVPPLPAELGPGPLHERDPHPSAAEFRWVAEHLWRAVAARE
jgi:hypothetical protein